MISHSQSGQDLFCMKMLNNRSNGVFVEIGSNDPIKFNNTYLFEKEYNWRGLMVEYTHSFLESYKIHRPNSIHLIADATQLNYFSIFDENNFPKHIDFLQIDLEVDNRSTLTTLENFDANVFDNYKFGVVCFEHDIYRGDHFETRAKSREIFEKRGYVRVFGDVKDHGFQYEDWYVHPNIVSRDIFEKYVTSESLDFSEILKRLEA